MKGQLLSLWHLNLKALTCEHNAAELLRTVTRLPSQCLSPPPLVVTML